MTLSRRSIAALLILVVVIFLALLVWVVRPLFTAKTPVVQPSALPGEIQPAPSPAAPVTPVTPAAPTPSPYTPSGGLTDQEQERQAEEALKRQALAFAARVGSYSSVDGFATLHEVYDQALPAVQNFLNQTTADLAKQHPATGASWGQTTTALAPQITGGLPLNSSQTAEVTVETRVTIETNGQSTANFQKTVLTYTKTDGTWLVSRVTWE